MKRFITIMTAIMLVLSITATTAYADSNRDGHPWKNNFLKNRKQSDRIWGHEDDAFDSDHFKDIGDYNWAKDSILSMASYRIIRGEGYGRFSPKRSTTELEIIIMLIRMLDLEDKLDDDPENYEELPDAYKGHQPDEWMIGYIALAWDEGILTEDNIKDFQPKSSASREEAAMYIMNALEGKEAYEDAYESLENWFEDSESINPRYGRHVYWMKAKGLMVGFNNRFHPKKALSRAEAAVLMHRIFKSYGFGFGYLESVQGYLEDVQFDDGEPKSIELDVSGDTEEFTLLTTTEVYAGKDRISLKELDRDYKGERVKLYINDDDNVVKIILYSTENSSDLQKVSGILEDFDYDMGELDWIEIDNDDYDTIHEDVEIHIGNSCHEDAEDEPEKLTNKYLGLKVKLYFEDSTVHKIVLYYNTFEGSLKYDANLDDNGSVDLIPKGSSDDEAYDFDADIQIFMNDEQISLSDFEDFDMDEDIDYAVKARLLGNGKLITLCIEYDD